MFYVNHAANFVGACLLGYVAIASRKRSADGERSGKPGPK
jgi:hypothetical protein